jgi:hypothetical protein
VVYCSTTNEVFVVAASQRNSPSLSLSVITGAVLLLAGAGQAQQAMSPAPSDVSLRITEPQPLNGRGEWLPPDSEAGFLSTTRITCAAELSGAPGSLPIRWRAAVFRGGHRVGAVTGSGPSFRFRPADASTRSCHGSVAVEIVAEVPPDPGTQAEADASTPNPKSKIQNPKCEARVRLQQDEIDQIRQEYLDMPGRKLALVPRSAFIDRAAYEQLAASG